MLVGSGREWPVWARDCSGKYKEDSTHPGETTHGAKQTEKLCGSTTKTLGISRGGLCIPQGVPKKGVFRFGKKGKLAPRYI